MTYQRTGFRRSTGKILHQEKVTMDADEMISQFSHWGAWTAHDLIARWNHQLKLGVTRADIAWLYQLIST